MSAALTALAVLVAQQVLEQDLQRERQPRDVEARLQRVEPVDLERAARQRQLGACIEAVGGGHVGLLAVAFTGLAGIIALASARGG